MTTIAFATSASTAGLVDDDRLVVPHLARLGVHVEPMVWDDPTADWEELDGVVVRTCWDYHHRRDELLDWVDRLERAAVPLWNPPAVLRWNSTKMYLRELAERGVPIVPTRFVEPEESVTLAAILEEEGWTEAVAKPVVSAGGHATWRVTPASAASDEPRFRALVAERPMMVQPFVREVATEGEWSLLFFEGAFSHAVLKRPSEGADAFLVQEHHGGTSRAAAPDAALVTQAARVVEAVGTPLLYARVDGCVMDGTLRLMELEALEPSLFLGHDAAAPARFAGAIASALEGRTRAAVVSSPRGGA
ncbi:MAG TPA: hypothetical protein VF041_13950 [Gemmatimonadaceae bacterium]